MRWIPDWVKWIIVAAVMLFFPTLGLIAGAYFNASLTSFIIGGVIGLLAGLLFGLLLVKVYSLSDDSLN